MVHRPANEYDPRYLRGIEQFNRRRYFDSHEIWEGLWIAETGPGRSFYKGLIQAAVALHHLDRGNAHGAIKLLRRSRRYLEPFRPRYLGLEIEGFLTSLERFVEWKLAGRRCAAESPPEIRLVNPPNLKNI